MGCTERNGPAAGGIASRVGHEVYSMANDRGFGNYITGPRFEDDLARFMESMRTDGMSETTIGEHVDNIRRCEAVLGGDVDPACRVVMGRELTKQSVLAFLLTGQPFSLASFRHPSSRNTK